MLLDQEMLDQAENACKEQERCKGNVTLATVLNGIKYSPYVARDICHGKYRYNFVQVLIIYMIKFWANLINNFMH